MADVTLINYSVVTGTTTVGEDITSDYATINFTSNITIETKNNIDGAKLDNSTSKYIKIVLPQDLRTGDVIALKGFCTSSKNTIGFNLSSTAGGTTVGTNTQTSDKTAQVFSYTVTSSDVLVGKSTFYIYRQTDVSTYFNSITVTTPDIVTQEIGYNIPIEDLRFKHLKYNPSRTNIFGFDITTSGWQSQTNSETSHTLLLSDGAKNSNSVTVTIPNGVNDGKKITKLVLVGAANVFANSTVTGSGTYIPDNKDQIVWENSSGASSATISFTATDRPEITNIYVFTNGYMNYTKNDVSLSFSPNNSSVAPSSSSEVNVSPTTTPSNFRVDYTYNAGVTGATGTNHLSTDTYGITPSTSLGSATVTASFGGNAFYNAASDAVYTLNIVDNTVHNKTISVSDMKYNPTFYSSYGLSATDGIDRTLGGFQFHFEGDGGIKLNNNSTICLFNRPAGKGKITITPQKNGTGTITIKKVVLTLTGNNTGTVKVNNGSDQIVNDASGSVTFDNLSGETFTIEGSGDAANDNEIDITAFQIFYTDPNGVLQVTKVRPTITFSKASDVVALGGAYTSPTITTVPGNFDISVSSSNTSLATVTTTKTDGTTPALVQLVTNASGTSTITASSTGNDYFDAATNATYTVTVAAAVATPTFSHASGSSVALGTSVTINTTTEGATIYYTTDGTTPTTSSTQGTTVTINNDVTIKAIAVKDGVVSDVATATYTVTKTNGKTWDFTTLDIANTINNDTWWVGNKEPNPNYYANQFVTTTNDGTYATYAAPSGSQMYELKFGRNGDVLKVSSLRLYPNSTGNTDGYLTYNNTNVKIGIPVEAGQTVRITFGGEDSKPATYGYTNATLESGSATAAAGSTEVLELKAIANGYVAISNTSNRPHLYKIEVYDDNRTEFGLRSVGNQDLTYDNSSITTFSHNIATVNQNNEATNYSLSSTNDSEFEFVSSDPSVIDVSNVGIAWDQSNGRFQITGIKVGDAGTAYITINYAGNDQYKPTSGTTALFTVTGKAAYGVNIDDQQVQRGQRSNFAPYITNAAGKRIGIRKTETSGEYETFVYGDDDDVDETNYSDYFDFTYAVVTPETGTGTNYDKITVGASDGIISTYTGSGSERVYAEVGAKRQFTVTATLKSTAPEGVQALFRNMDPAPTSTATITIIEAAAQIELDFYWDAAMTIPVTGPGSDKDYKLSGSTGLFGESGTFPNGFPNGRMMYVKVKNAGDNIWFSFMKNGDAADIKSNPKLDKSKQIYQYRRGIPIYIDETLVSGDYVCVNAVATSPQQDGSEPLDGGVAKMKFMIVAHDRPAQPTYDPVSPDKGDAPNLNFEGKKIMTTAENVVAYGEGASKGSAGRGNLVYGKFSTSSIYTTAQLINESTVSSGIDNVPVISTEVNKRRFTAVQIRTESEGNEYISLQTYTEYYYLFDTTLKLDLPSTTNRINQGGTYVLGKTTFGNNLPYKVTWVNKGNKGLDGADPEYKGDPVNQEVDYYELNSNKKVRFVIEDEDRNGAEGTTVDQYTGTVTAGTSPGWVKVRAIYDGSIEKEYHGGKNYINTDNAAKNGGVQVGEPQYRSYTASSTAEYYVYVNSVKGEPIITPPSRKFTSTQEYTIEAPKDWDVRYTIDGTDPTPTTGTKLSANKSIKLVTGQTITVKAIAYNPAKEDWDSDNKSRIVQETYTKVDPLPDPIFNPDGVPTPYVYYTNTLTVQISCNYAGSMIFYTTDGTEPVRGADNTYQYSGLSKVIISGNKAIKAIAWDPVSDIYSNVVTSNYLYSTDMEKPFFQISEDGQTWNGMDENGNLTANGTYWNAGQSQEITPATQIRIQTADGLGTIYFTLNGNMPTEKDMVYSGTPFTLAKTTTGRAIVMLDEASSGMAWATFIINPNRYPVWEAVQSTTPNGTLNPNQRVITTKANLAVQNSGSGINTGSIENDEDVVYAQPDITATFGGYDNKEWTYMTIADDAIGIPLDGVGAYSINSSDNAKMEEKFQVKPGVAAGDNYNHIFTNSTTYPTTHERTFKMPSKGTYMKFEPEKDGDLTIWALQHGSLNYHEGEVLCKTFIRYRPVYLIDEQGNSIQVKKVNGVDQMWSSARLSNAWSNIKATAEANKWPKYTNGEDEHKNDPEYGETINYKGETTFVANKAFSQEESTAIYNLYNNYITTNNIAIGDQLKPFAIHTGTSISQTNGLYVDASNDGTGYIMLTGGYVKYIFPVKAGKTYFFFGQGTKIGIRGFQFVPTEDEEDVKARHKVTITKDETTYTVDGAEKTPAEAVSACADKPANVTLSGRTFQKDTWASLVLPFSVSVAQIEKVFGAYTDIVHFNDIKNWGDNSYKLFLKRHWHKMVVAGTPILIKPTKLVENPVFYGVQLEASTVDEMEATTVSDQYKMTGVLTKTVGALLHDDYYINTKGELTHMAAASSDVNATYAWIKYLGNPGAAKMLSLGFSSYEDDYYDEDAEITGIRIALYDETGIDTFTDDDSIYNLSGQKVGCGSLKNLPKGVYIVNGKKVVVK